MHIVCKFPINDRQLFIIHSQLFIIMCFVGDLGVDGKGKFGYICAGCNCRTVRQRVERVAAELMREWDWAV
jgi:hypothetical protein